MWSLQSLGEVESVKSEVLEGDRNLGSADLLFGRIYKICK